MSGGSCKNEKGGGGVQVNFFKALGELCLRVTQERDMNGILIFKCELKNINLMSVLSILVWLAQYVNLISILIYQDN